MSEHNEGKVRHTPGPWSIARNNGDFALHGPDGFHVLKIRVGVIPTNHDSTLIASAPDLLAALRRIYEVQGTIHCNYSCGKCLRCRMPEVAAALERAERKG